MMFHHEVGYCFCVPQNCVGDVVAGQQRECYLWGIMSLLCPTTMMVIAASLPSCCHLEASFCVAAIVVSCCSVGDEDSGECCSSGNAVSVGVGCSGSVCPFNAVSILSLVSVSLSISLSGS